MEHRPGYWTYAGATGLAIALAQAASAGFAIHGHMEVALTLGLLFASVFILTPPAQRSDIKRLWGTVFLALGGLILASGAGVLFEVSIGFGVMIHAPGEAARQAAPRLVLALSFLVAGGAYLGVFRLGWRLVEPAYGVARPPAWTQLFH